MSEHSWSAGLWLSCPTCGTGKAFVGLDAAHRVAVGCAGCRAVVPVADPVALGLSAVDVRRLLARDARDDGRYVVDARPADRPSRVGPRNGRPASRHAEAAA